MSKSNPDQLVYNAFVTVAGCLSPETIDLILIDIETWRGWDIDQFRRALQQRRPVTHTNNLLRAKGYSLEGG